jgi:hypothetical protein
MDPSSFRKMTTITAIPRSSSKNLSRFGNLRLITRDLARKGLDHPGDDGVAKFIALLPKGANEQ